MSIHTLDQRRSASILAKNLARDAVEARREDAIAFLSDGESMLQQGLYAGADKVRLADMAGFLRDCVSDLVGGMRKDLDDAGLHDEPAEIDMAELDALIAEIGK